MRLLEQSSLTLQKRSAKGTLVISASEWKIITTTYTERFLSSLIALISILRRPMMNARRVWASRNEGVDKCVSQW